MYEYEILYKDTNETDFFWGYDVKDLESRHPELVKRGYTILMREFID